MKEHRVSLDIVLCILVFYIDFPFYILTTLFKHSCKYEYLLLKVQTRMETVFQTEQHKDIDHKMAWGAENNDVAYLKIMGVEESTISLCQSLWNSTQDWKSNCLAKL